MQDGTILGIDPSMTKRMPVALFTLGLFVFFMWLGLTLVYSALNAIEFGPRQYIEVGVGMVFVTLAVVNLAVSLTCFLARSDEKASRSLRWLGGFRPRWH